MNIYKIDGEQIYPAGDAVVIVAAKDAEQAAGLAANILKEPKEPVLLGEASSGYKEPTIIYENDTDY